MSKLSTFNQGEKPFSKQLNSNGKWQSCSHCQDSLVRHVRLGKPYLRCSCCCVVVNLL